MNISVFNGRAKQIPSKASQLSSKILFIMALLISSISVAGDYDNIDQIQDDKALVQALKNQRRAHFIQAANLTVSRLLEDDNDGLRHQKWVAKTSVGQSVTIVYNVDMGIRVPLQVGDKFAVGGEFIWTKTGGLLHWVHEDPRDKRPDGYVYVDGVIYGDVEAHR